MTYFCCLLPLPWYYRTRITHYQGTTAHFDPITAANPNILLQHKLLSLSLRKWSISKTGLVGQVTVTAWPLTFQTQHVQVLRGGPGGQCVSVRRHVASGSCRRDTQFRAPWQCSERARGLSPRRRLHTHSRFPLSGRKKNPNLYPTKLHKTQHRTNGNDCCWFTSPGQICHHTAPYLQTVQKRSMPILFCSFPSWVLYSWNFLSGLVVIFRLNAPFVYWLKVFIAQRLLDNFTAVFPNRFWRVTQIAPTLGHYPVPLPKSCMNNIFHRNAHLFQFHTQLKGNTSQTIINNFTRRLSWINEAVGSVFPCQFTLHKYVVVKTLIKKKKQPITQIKRPHYPTWVIIPKVGNQCFRRKVKARETLF